MFAWYLQKLCVNLVISMCIGKGWRNQEKGGFEHHYGDATAVWLGYSPVI